MATRTRTQAILLPLIALLGAWLIAACGDAAAPEATTPTDVKFTIESGALARQMRGQVTELIPAEIELVAGQNIIIHNEDQALHYFLSTPVWPGETMTKHFDEPGTYRYSGAFTCSIGSGNSLTVHVTERPDGSS